jgi:hypothetical protein
MFWRCDAQLRHREGYGRRRALDAAETAPIPLDLGRARAKPAAPAAASHDQVIRGERA